MSVPIADTMIFAFTCSQVRAFDGSFSKASFLRINSSIFHWANGCWDSSCAMLSHSSSTSWSFSCLLNWKIGASWAFMVVTVARKPRRFKQGYKRGEGKCLSPSRPIAHTFRFN